MAIDEGNNHGPADNREVLEYDGTTGAVQRWYAYGLDPDAVLSQMNLSSGYTRDDGPRHPRLNHRHTPAPPRSP
jgi:hypothetical protein